MSYKNIREFITFLETKNDLLRIKVPVSQHLEIAEITDRVIKSGGPALLFENVVGFSAPVLTNLFGTHQRTAWALGVEQTDELTDKVREILGLVKNPPTSMWEKLKTLKDIVGMARTQPKLIKTAPCQQIILTGDDANLETLPHLQCWPMDGGRYITLPLVISRDPDSNRRNVGTYRMQIYDEKTAGMHWQTHKVGASHYRTGKEKGLERLEVAVVLGGDPTTIWTGALPIPPDMDELAVAGIIRDTPVEMVKCRTIDLEVPAHSEFVLEGYVVPGELKTEGPFGDHTGYYTPKEPFPTFTLTGIMQRKNPIYLTTVVGKPILEDAHIGKVIERSFLPLIRMLHPEVVDFSMPPAAWFQGMAIVSIKKRYPGQAKKVMMGLWGMGQLALTKMIIVVDHDVNVHDINDVIWAVTTKTDAARDITIIDNAPTDTLDPASPMVNLGSKLGIDATQKTKEEGFEREIQEEVKVDDDTKKLVDSKWSNYGL